MVRKLVRTLLFSLILGPMSAYGLGLGEIHLYSALNEPMAAEIDLLSVEAGDLESMDAGLASYETFAKFGVERPSHLAFLRFNVAKNSAGRPVLKVTSTQPIREPFLDFLIELTWSKGRLLREYTVLLDPPHVAERSRTAPPPAVAPAQSSDIRTVSGEKPKMAAKKPAPMATSRSATSTTSAPTARSAPRASGDIAHKVQADETLWSIAKALRPNESVSIHQMVMALYKANPDAFLDNNINKLRKGAVLRLDDPSMVNRIDTAEAVREVKRQSRQWQDMKQEMATEGESRPTVSSEAKPAKQVATREGAKLKLVSPEGKEGAMEQGAGSGSSNLEAVRKDLVLALEEVELQRQENKQLRGKLEELEAQIASMQRLLSLKSDDLAQLQQQLGQEPTETAEPEAKSEPEKKPLVADGKKEAPAAEQPAATDSKTEMAAAKVEAQKTETKPEPKPVAKPKPVVKPQPKPEPSFIDTVLGDPMLLGAGGLGILLLVLLGMVIKRRMAGGSFQESILTGGTSSMLNPKSEEQSSSMETSLISDLTDDGVGMPMQDSEVDPVTEADVYMAYGRHQQAEELLKEALEKEPERHELLVKLMEVYYKTKNKSAFEKQASAAYTALDGQGAMWDKIVAMGHDLAPENTLFADAPENIEPIAEEDEEDTSVAIDDVLDIGLDLDALAAEMEPSDDFGSDSGSDDDMDLDLGIDLGEEESSDDSSSSDDDLDLNLGEDTSDDSTDLDMDLGDLDFDSAEESEASSSESDDGLDMGLGDLDFETDSSADDSSEEAAAEDSGLDMDLDGLDFETEADTGAEETPAVDADDALDMGDLDLDSGDDKPAADEGGLEFSVDDLDMGEPETAPEPAAESSDDSGLDFDAGELSLDDDASADLELDMDSSGSEPEAAESKSDDDPLADLDLGDDDLGDLGDLDLGDDDFGGGMDEVGTKLDLATAYVEMGDADGAKEMLEEVLADGDDTQKAKAKELLDQIAKG